MCQIYTLENSNFKESKLPLSINHILKKNNPNVTRPDKSTRGNNIRHAEASPATPATDGTDDQQLLKGTPLVSRIV